MTLEDFIDRRLRELLDTCKVSGGEGGIRNTVFALSLIIYTDTKNPKPEMVLQILRLDSVMQSQPSLPHPEWIQIGHKGPERLN